MGTTRPLLDAEELVENAKEFFGPALRAMSQNNDMEFRATFAQGLGGVFALWPSPFKDFPLRIVDVKVRGEEEWLVTTNDNDKWVFERLPEDEAQEVADTINNA